MMMNLDSSIAASVEGCIWWILRWSVPTISGSRRKASVMSSKMSFCHGIMLIGSSCRTLKDSSGLVCDAYINLYLEIDNLVILMKLSPCCIVLCLWISKTVRIVEKLYNNLPNFVWCLPTLRQINDNANLKKNLMNCLNIVTVIKYSTVRFRCSLFDFCFCFKFCLCTVVHLLLQEFIFSLKSSLSAQRLRPGMRVEVF